MTIFLQSSNLTKWLGEKFNVVKNVYYKKEEQTREVNNEEFENTCVVIQFGSEKENFRISMKELTKNFFYFNKKSSICSFVNKRKFEHFSHISLQNFKILIKLATEGKYYKMF